ncbi:unnamed protein product [Chondrus crispus]|uniref:Hyaluronan/mRNA-binding protein domain-containing protein n=1 Tax=Chondrus crispus TaxID=2769 RepID=R7Q4V9_CHOCR|nr:unnamed protein product [Chondrus crispus]CDF33044.1 unnamed protein product [Chondrus crispus]|eukprot:XP_005712847.1 unnamed protein product [Chondrus crispus]
MNSFALLQDDVEDATDLAVPSKGTPAETPAEAVQDARATADDTAAPSTDADAATSANPADPEGKPRPTPKEKDLTLEEYLAQKAQKSSSLTSLSKGARKPNDGVSSGFENMSLLNKDDPAHGPAKDSLMGSVPVKEQHENKALKDSTHAAVAKNAEIQSFFKRDPASDRRQYSGPRRGGDFRRGGYDSRRGDREGAQHDPDSRQRADGDRSYRNDTHAPRYEGRGGRGDSRGGRFEGRGGRSEGRGGRYERGMDRDGRRDNRGTYGRGRGQDGPGPNGHRSYGNGPKVPMAPNVDDTAAFPSL